MPQPPQFCLSLVRFAHALGHTVRPAPQVEQVVPKQAAPVAQEVLAAQVVPQAVPLHANAPQAWVDGAGQLPAPSQEAALVAVVPAQLAVRHEMAVVAKTQAADMPLHDPPQGAVPVQAVCPVRGAPVTRLQVPASAVEALQYSHEPVHAVLQHTPSTQELLEHSRAAAHD
jgi:hypothetical protein